MKKQKTKYKIDTKKFFTRIFYILLLLVIIIFCIYFIKKFNSSEVSTSNIEYSSSSESTTETTENAETLEDTTIKMCAIGDIMCHNTQYQAAYNKSTDTYDFSYVFNNISDYLKNADITIGNLETTFAGKARGYSSYPTFNTPEALATNLKDVGIDVLSTANNHSLDKGYSGIENTLKVLNSNELSHMGTYTSSEDRDKILVKEVNGIKIAFLSYTYGTNGIPIPSGKDYRINLIDKDLIKKDLDSAKALNVDLISVNMHWGNEYRLKSTTEQEELADFLFENGVDIILGSHPHVLEPMEKRTITLPDGTKKDGFLIYSLGNFVSGQTKDYTNQSIILNLTITKHKEGNISIDNVEYIPIYVDGRSSLGSKRFRILDIEKSISDYENKTDSSITSDLYNNLQKALKSIKEILNYNV